MKLTNVHYEYRGNDTWRIYFKDALEADDFRNERTDGQKAQIAMLLPIFTNSKGIQYYVEAKLTGQFNILRRYVKDVTNDWFSNDVWRALVKKIEGSDLNYIFDEIDLRYDATVDKCFFRIRCMNGTWTELFVKNMLNSQFGATAQGAGYSDTDTAYQGGFCVRRICCGIGFGHHRDRYGSEEERIIFTVKNFCRGEADIVKVSPWTNTFIGTNKENEKEYSWVDFKQYMQKLSATGTDIWDIEWEYDETCPMTGTEVADKLHVYLKPLAYKRLFEEEDKEKPMQILKNITDISSCMTKVLGCGTLYYYNLYFDDKSDLKNVNDKHINKSMDNSVKGAYYIRVVSYNKELPKNISSATLVWDQEENRYSVEDFTSATEMARLGADFDKETQEKEANNNKEEMNMGPKDTTFTEYCRRLYWGAVAPVKPVKPTKILIQGTATIIWWSDGTKTVVKCQKGDKMDPEKGIAMCVMKKFMGTNEKHSNYLDFAKPAIAEYEKKQAAEKAKKKAEADKRRRAVAKKKGAAGNTNYKRGAKGKTEAKAEKEPESKEES